MFNVISPLCLDRPSSYPHNIAADRLPAPLGKFISEEVYLGKLRSCHKIVDHSCTTFIDVSKGEETKQGNSYKVSVLADEWTTPWLILWGKNIEEVHMIVRIAGRYHQRNLNFCIITFYDPQRAAITRALETAGLPTGCVYNVDSFQGIVHTPRIREP